MKWAAKDKQSSDNVVESSSNESDYAGFGLDKQSSNQPVGDYRHHKRTPIPIVTASEKKGSRPTPSNQRNFASAVDEGRCNNDDDTKQRSNGKGGCTEGGSVEQGERTGSRDGSCFSRENLQLDDQDLSYFQRCALLFLGGGLGLAQDGILGLVS